MKSKIVKPEPIIDFNPIIIELRLESKEDVYDMYAALNHTGYDIAKGRHHNDKRSAINANMELFGIICDAAKALK